MRSDNYFSKDLYQIPVKNLAGKTTTLAPYRGKVMLIVNVASRCGFTSQYAELQSLYDAFKEEGFVVLGFPCNQFLRQEPDEAQAIKAWTQSCFQITFPLFGKVDVRGRSQAPLYRYLARCIEKKPWILIPWNFTKVLVNSEGRVLKRFLPTTAIEVIRQEIIHLLPGQNKHF